MNFVHITGVEINFLLLNFLLLQILQIQGVIQIESGVQQDLKADLAIFQVEVGVPITATYTSLNPEVIRNFLILGLYAGIAGPINIEIKMPLKSLLIP